MTNATLVTSSEVRTMVMRVARDRDPESRRIMRSVADGQRGAQRHAGQRREKLQREAWSPKDLRMSQAKAAAMKTSIR